MSQVKIEKNVVARAKERPKHFTIRLRNRLSVSAGVPSQWLAIYVVHRGELVQSFPFELSELAEARSLDFEFDERAIKTAEAIRSSRLGTHVYLSGARKGEVDSSSLDSGVFLGRFPVMPVGIELDARSLVQLFLGRLAKLREVQPAVSGQLAEREFETLVRPLDPKRRVAKSLAELRKVTVLAEAPTLVKRSTITTRVVLDK